jgi:hypothetical protein
MDKVTCIAFILYQFATTEEKKELAIQLLNGDVSLWELKKNNNNVLADITSAEVLFKKRDIDLNLVQDFAARFLLVEA